MPNPTQFRSDLEALINRHSMENGSNTPDFMLADYLINCLMLFEQTTNRREIWYGRAPEQVATVLTGSVPSTGEVQP